MLAGLKGDCCIMGFMVMGATAFRDGDKSGFIFLLRLTLLLSE
jgi:hypothetical protein